MTTSTQLQVVLVSQILPVEQLFRLVVHVLTVNLNTYA